MAKWHHNVTEEIHKLVLSSTHTEDGLTGVSADVKSIMKQLHHVEAAATAAAAAAAGKTPSALDDVLDPVWDDYDPNNFQDYDIDDDDDDDGVDAIFEEFVEKVGRVGCALSYRGRPMRRLVPARGPDSSLVDSRHFKSFFFTDFDEILRFIVLFC